MEAARALTKDGSYGFGIPLGDSWYYMALVVGYVPSGAKDVTYRYYPFSNDISFTVLNGQIVTPVAASLAD